MQNYEPCPRKELNRRTIYRTRELGIPKDYGSSVLCDIGSAVRLGDGAEHREDIQSHVYQAPEIILDIPRTYSVDIWNVGAWSVPTTQNSIPILIFASLFIGLGRV
jgi:serine/threonine-protein kinase SRPK3